MPLTKRVSMTPLTPATMRADFKVFLDACVLANFGVADLLLRLTKRPRQFLPAWSEEILAEVFRTQTQRLGWPEELATSFGRELRTHFPEAMVAGYGHLAEGLDVNPKDRNHRGRAETRSRGCADPTRQIDAAVRESGPRRPQSGLSGRPFGLIRHPVDSPVLPIGYWLCIDEGHGSGYFSAHNPPCPFGVRARGRAVFRSASAFLGHPAVNWQLTNTPTSLETARRNPPPPPGGAV